MNFKLTSQKSRDAVKEYIDKLPDTKVYNVSIVLHRERRSIDQNCLYWLWLACISSETGQDKDSLHDYFKQSILGFEIRAVFLGTEHSREIRKEVSTSTLDTKQFADYLEKIQHFASAELGIVLPNPEDSFWNNFHEQYKNYI